MFADSTSPNYRHPVHRSFKYWICPITHKPFNNSWSELLPFDSCEHCKPKGPPDANLDFPSVDRELEELMFAAHPAPQGRPVVDSRPEPPCLDGLRRAVLQQIFSAIPYPDQCPPED